MTRNKKTRIWTILVPILFIVMISAISCGYGILCNEVFFDGAKSFFLSSRTYEIKKAIHCAARETLLRRFIILFAISCLLHGLENKIKHIVTLRNICMIFMILYSVVYCGYLHYDVLSETKNMIKIHMAMQGVMALIFTISYNISQHYSLTVIAKKWEIKHYPVIVSHIFGFATAFLIHMATNISMILMLTF